MSEDQAAVKIQARYKGNMQRKKLKEKKEKARKAKEKKEEEDAATLI